MPADINVLESRYERKFVLNYEQALGIKRLIASHPAHFRKAFPDRQINNIYYDTSDFSHYRENVAGVSPRKKVRIRWYGDFDSEGKNTLEIKHKSGEVVFKNSLPVDWEIRGERSLPAVSNNSLLLRDNIYHAVLKNSYLRQYYVTSDNQIRLTVDMQLKFGSVNGGWPTAPSRRLPQTIIELKYPLEAEEEASRLSNYFPFRLNKSSKYEQGVSLCYPHLVVI